MENHWFTVWLVGYSALTELMEMHCWLENLPEFRYFLVKDIPKQHLWWRRHTGDRLVGLRQYWITSIGYSVLVKGLMTDAKHPSTKWSTLGWRFEMYSPDRKVWYFDYCCPEPEVLFLMAHFSVIGVGLYNGFAPNPVVKTHYLNQWWPISLTCICGPFY